MIQQAPAPQAPKDGKMKKGPDNCIYFGYILVCGVMTGLTVEQRDDSSSRDNYVEHISYITLIIFCETLSLRIYNVLSCMQYAVIQYAVIQYAVNV